jgi:hypothetical protein
MSLLLVRLCCWYLGWLNSLTRGQKLDRIASRVADSGKWQLCSGRTRALGQRTCGDSFDHLAADLGLTRFFLARRFRSAGPSKDLHLVGTNRDHSPTRVGGCERTAERTPCGSSV